MGECGTPVRRLFLLLLLIPGVVRKDQELRKRAQDRLSESTGFPMLPGSRIDAAQFIF